MSNKAIDRDYLLTQLKNLDRVILSSKYQKALNAGDGIEIDSLTDTISTEVPFSVVNGKICVTFEE